ncbi:unnamed protein product [Sphagnum balticum]
MTTSRVHIKKTKLVLLLLLHWSFFFCHAEDIDEAMIVPTGLILPHKPARVCLVLILAGKAARVSVVSCGADSTRVSHEPYGADSARQFCCFVGLIQLGKLARVKSN